MASQVGLVKVGVSSNLEKRRSRLQAETGLPLRIVYQTDTLQRLDAFAFEKYCHYALGEYRTHGEWFQCPIDEAVSIILEAIHGGLATSPIPPTYIEPIQLSPPPAGPFASLEAIAERGAYLAMH